LPYPAKFRHLMQTAEFSATVPDVVRLAFALCCAEQDSCGWTGWIIEAAWNGESDAEWAERKFVPTADNQRCPDCGKQTFRTGLARHYGLQSVQPVEAINHDVVPITFDDEPSTEESS
jgi:hypothetical protein